MEFIKDPLSIIQRLNWVKAAIRTLAQAYISVRGEGIPWHIEKWPWEERFKTFLAEMETAFKGHVYRVKEPR